MKKARRSSVESGEIARFSEIASSWWKPDGPLGPLHKMNPCRIAYIRDAIRDAGHGKPDKLKPLAGLDLLDVGCGGGILAEPLARLGATVTGIDASSEAIAEATRHAKVSELSIDYRAASAEELAASGRRFDVITAMEIVEHVADLDAFVGSLALLLKPGGVMILSTVNRTPQSFLLGIVAAEYILRWVPRGTHRWSKFVRPSELVQKLEAEGITVTDLTGVTYNPLTGAFARAAHRLGLNYMLTARH